MTKKLTPIFATSSDLSDVAKEVCLARPLQFLDAGLRDNKIIPVFFEFPVNEFLDICIACDIGVKVPTRVVPQRRGGEKYAIEIGDVCGVAIGGCRHIVGQRLLAGQIAPIGDGVSASEIYTLFNKTIKRSFTKIHSYYVGAEALRLFEGGTRLTPSEKSPPQYDLAR